MSETNGVNLNSSLPLAEDDAPRTRHIYVLTAEREVRKGRYIYLIPAGMVVGEDLLSANKAEHQIGIPLTSDEKLVEVKPLADGGPKVGTLFLEK
jgi:hypothetical protein